MDDLKEKAEDLKVGLSSFIDGASQIILGRLKNPIISTYAIAWTIYNWKPIVYFIFANKSVDDKIIHIEKIYGDLCANLLWPLLPLFIYLILLPYVNVFIDYCIRISVILTQKNRKKIISNKIKLDTMLGEEEIEKQRVLTVASKKAMKYETLQNLEYTNKNLEISLHEERTRYRQAQRRNTEEFKKLREQYELQINELQGYINDLQSKFSAENSSAHEHHMQVKGSLMNKNQELVNEIKKYQEEKIMLLKELNEYKKLSDK